ncbi:hypothetical protein ACFS3A_08710 [Flavobacterium notoginsengisoli]
MIENLENLKKLTVLYLNTLKPVSEEKNMYEAKIKLSSYTELSSIITQILKSCILVLEINANTETDVSLMLEMVLQLLPVDEFELLDRISEIVNVQDLEE